MRAPVRRRAGFTLIELMVALVVGGIFVGSVYAVAKASTRHFYQQYGTAQMHASLRYAVNQLKKDISKAGLFASPNAGLAALQTECGPPSGVHDPNGTGAIAGISAFTDNCTTQPECNLATRLERTANMVQADSLVLLGNYATASEYPIARALVSGGNQVAVEPQWHAFQRDFTTWFHQAGSAPSVGLGELGGVSGPLLNQAFMQGRLVSLRTRSGGTFFSTISGAVTLPSTETSPVLVPLDQSIPPGCNVSGGWISPLSFIRYVVEDVPRDSASATRFAGLQGDALQLIRREVQPGNKTSPLRPCVNAGEACSPDRVVLDHVVDFNVDFRLATPTTPAVVDVIPLLSDNALSRVLTPGQIQNTPELVRSVIINIAVRSSEIDAQLVHQPNGGKVSMWDPLLTYYQPIPGMPSNAPGWRAARVRAMTAEIFVPNIAYAGH